jgi:adenylate kinase family enzyme
VDRALYGLEKGGFSVADEKLSERIKDGWKDEIIILWDNLPKWAKEVEVLEADVGKLKDLVDFNERIINRLRREKEEAESVKRRVQYVLDKAKKAKAEIHPYEIEVALMGEKKP